MLNHSLYITDVHFKCEEDSLHTKFRLPKYTFFHDLTLHFRVLFVVFLHAIAYLDCISLYYIMNNRIAGIKKSKYVFITPSNDV